MNTTGSGRMLAGVISVTAIFSFILAGASFDVDFVFIGLFLLACAFSAYAIGRKEDAREREQRVMRYRDNRWARKN